MLKYAIIFILFICTSVSAFADQIKLISPAESYNISGNQVVYLPVYFNISEEGYVYSNPKGPGTGKNLSISVTAQERSFDFVYLSAPVQYTSPLSEEWVWIHKIQHKILIPVDPSELKNDNILHLNVEALFCDDTNCTPVTDSITVKYQLSEENSEFITRAVPNDFIQIDLDTATISNKSADLLSIADHDFNPIFFDNQKVASLLPAIITAFIAGIILNVMPCVLPVLGIKIMSITRLHSHSKKTLMLHGLMYSAGVIFSFLVLAGLAAFAGANWGSLFQSRWFIITMSVIIFSLSLSMLGVYTLQTPSFIQNFSSSSSLITTSFLNGLLATVLATPCSGPFLGATLAWTLTQSATVIFAVFISIGAGFTFPFLLLSLFPSLIHRLPKGGTWSVFIQRVLGFILIASVIYFLSTLSETYILFTLIVLLFTGIGLWQFGQNFTPVAGLTKRRTSLATLLILIIVGTIVAHRLMLSTSENIPQKINFSYESLYSEVEKGNIVFLQFTANWCPNCAYLEQTVLHTPDFQMLVDSHSVIYMKADLTESNSEAEKLLEKLGSRSIPFSAVFYPGGFTQPIGLRDMFSIEDVQKSLESAKEKSQNTKNNVLEIDTITL